MVLISEYYMSQWVILHVFVWFAVVVILIRITNIIIAVVIQMEEGERSQQKIKRQYCFDDLSGLF
jgi:hypothetical protein